MNRSSRAVPERRRISGPGELLQAVPYLLGFHPTGSLVLVGLDAGTLVVTARLDLADAALDGVLAHALTAMVRGGTTSVIAAVYDDDGDGTLTDEAVAVRLVVDADTAGCDVADVLLVRRGRWRSLTCTSSGCCPPEGRELPSAPSAFAAAATYDGVVALPDRAALEQVLDPLPEAQRAAVGEAIAAAENATMAATLDGGAKRHERASKRALFAAARAADEPGWPGLPADEEVATFGAALTIRAVRDAVWTAVDAGRLDGRPLWRELARRLPSPYDAAPLFLFGWACWRDGNGALASVAAQRAVESDPEYSAADLLLAALSYAVDPRQMPRLKLGRPA